MTTKCKCSK